MCKCLQETHSLPLDESKWQKEWGDKTQAVFNSNAEVAKKTDASTAVLLNNQSLKFGTVRKDTGGRILAAEIRLLRFSSGQRLRLHVLLPKTKTRRFL